VPSGKPAILVEKIAIAEQGSLLMSAGGTPVQPAIRLPFDHDYYFGFSCGAGRRNHFDGDLRHTKKPSAELPCNPAHDRFISKGMKNLRVPSR